jgi:hypothetical protein
MFTNNCNVHYYERYVNLEIRAPALPRIEGVAMGSPRGCQGVPLRALGKIFRDVGTYFGKAVPARCHGAPFVGVPWVLFFPETEPLGEPLAKPFAIPSRY